MSVSVGRDDAAAIALGVVSAEELTAFTRLVEREPALASIVESYGRVAALLALAAPPAVPPPELRSRVVRSAVR